MKFCKDCKHLVGDQCYSEKLHGRDPVTGNQIHISARICRDSYARCGPEASGFDQREEPQTLVQKAIFYFKQGINGGTI